jgi:predicted CoA-binding protein
MQGKGKGSVSLSFSSEKYDKVYFIPEKVDGVPVFNETKSTVRQFMQLTELVTKLMWWTDGHAVQFPLIYLSS